MSHKISRAMLNKLGLQRISCNSVDRGSWGAMISSGFYTQRQTGASLVELFVVAPALLFLGLGTVQIGLLYHAKTTLNYATFEAARVGSVSHAQVEPMMGELAYRLALFMAERGQNKVQEVRWHELWLIRLTPHLAISRY